MYAKPHLNQRIARWLMLLTDLDLEFVHHKSIKGQTIADQLAEAPLSGEQFTNFNFPDELIATLSLCKESYPMTLFFDGSKCQHGGGAGVVLIPLDAEPMPLSFWLDFLCTNNTAEYEALVLGLQLQSCLQQISSRTVVRLFEALPLSFYTDECLLASWYSSVVGITCFVCG